VNNRECGDLAVQFKILGEPKTKEQMSCRTFLARKRWANSEAKQSPNLNVVAMTFAARHRRKSDKCLERVARAENQLQNHQQKQLLNRTTSNTNQNAVGHAANKKGPRIFSLKDGGPNQKTPGPVRVTTWPVVSHPSLNAPALHVSGQINAVSLFRLVE
jgi:hypothetical protein